MKRIQSRNGMWHDASMVAKGVLELEPVWWASEPVRRAARSQSEHVECLRLELWEVLNEEPACRIDQCPVEARRKNVLAVVGHGAHVSGLSEGEVWQRTGLMLMAIESVWNQASA